MESNNDTETPERQQSQSSSMLPRTLSLHRKIASLQLDPSTPLLILDSPTIPEITEYE